MSADGPVPQQTADAPQAAPDAPQQTQEGGQGQQDVLMQRLDEMSQQMAQLAQTKPPEGEPQYGIEDLPYQDFSQFEGPDFGQPQDQYGYQDQGQYQPGQYAPDPAMDAHAQQQQAMQQLDQYVQQRVQQAIEPVRIEQQVTELQNRYPDLQKPEVYTKVFNQAVQEAKRMGNPEMARQPRMIELVYLAQTGQERASQETPADGGQQGVHLEGGGAAPQEPEMDAADRMLQAWGVNPNGG